MIISRKRRTKLSVFELSDEPKRRVRRLTNKIVNDVILSVSAANQILLTQPNAAGTRIQQVVVMPEQVDLLIECLQEAKAEIGSPEGAPPELYVLVRSTIGP